MSVLSGANARRRKEAGIDIVRDDKRSLWVVVDTVTGVELGSSQYDTRAESIANDVAREIVTHDRKDRVKWAKRIR